MCYRFLWGVSANAHVHFTVNTLAQQTNTKTSMSLEQIVLLPIAFLVLVEMSTSRDCRCDF